MDEIVREFLVESNENLDRLDRDFIVLEKDPESVETMASVFRTIHTIKGTCGFLGFFKLEKLAHSGENLLSRLRDGVLKLTPEITSGLLSMVDAVREMLSNIEATEQEGDGDYSNLIESLKRLQSSHAATLPPPAPSKPLETSLQSSAPPESQERPLETLPPPQPQETPVETEKAAGAAEDGSKSTIGEILIRERLATREQVVTALDQQLGGDPRRLGEILVEQGSVEPKAVLEALVQQQGETRGSALASANIRVDVARLDKLMNLVGELVLTRNQILRDATRDLSPSLFRASQRLDMITTELQEGVLKTRMQPIDTIWNRFPRVVRDLAVFCNKQVRVEMEGQDTELDKTLIEAIKDPLTHLVRNSIDHGVETPAEREKAGKPAEGRLLLRAYHEAGWVNIEVSDDGAGVDLTRVVRKAVERGSITSEQAAKMNEHDALRLLFLPGLSTAEKVTNVSGRGVGMDVVKTNIERIGGTVDIQSRVGQGTTVKVKIPLTLTIIPALIVTSGGDRFAIPQVSLLELVRLQGKAALKGIENVHGAPVYRLRGRLLPLVLLNKELNPESAGSLLSGSSATESGSNDGVRSSRLDFEKVKSIHEAWTSKLRQFLDGAGSLDEEEAGRNDGCALGKWLYSEGMKEYGYLQEVRDLETCHTAFHGQVKKVILRKKSGDMAGAESELNGLEAFSSRILGLLDAARDHVAENRTTNIVVLETDGKRFGLVVDQINNTAEIVVKPLGKHVKDLSVFAGATIMGDGTVALILDVVGLTRRAGVVSDIRAKTLCEKEEPGQKLENRQSLLLFSGADDGRMAIPLSFVTRLEEFPSSSVERAGSQEVLQYRGDILKLARVSNLLQERRRNPRSAPASTGPQADGEKIQVVVHSDDERSIGLVVGTILGIVEEDLSIKRTTQRKGTLGSAVIRGHVTEILDLDGLFGAQKPAATGNLPDAVVAN